MFNLIKKHSLFTKISTYYTLILICSSVAIIYFTTQLVTSKVTALNISLQTNILDHMSKSLDNLYDDINNLTKVLAYEGNLENPFYGFLNTNNATDTALQMNYDFSRFFLNFNSSKYVISSILILNNTSDTPYFWSNNNITRVNEYHFAQQAWYQHIKKNSQQITILDSNIPDYFINFSTNKYMVTFARNIYDIQKIKDLRDIGTIIVNLQTDTFQNIFETYTKDFQGDFYILGEDGTVIYDYSNQYTGKKLDTFSTLANELAEDHGSKFIQLDEDKFINYKTIPEFHWKIVTVIPEKQLTQGIKQINFTIMLTVIITIACLLLVLLLISRSFFKRLNFILRAIRRIEEGNFESVIQMQQKDEIGQLAGSIDVMRLRLKHFIETSYISNIRQQETELKALQMQINPHFLYNTLESIRMKATLNQDTEVSSMIKILADLFRWNVKEKHVVISLEEELEFIHTYLEIQNIRFEDRITFTMDVPPELMSYGIPKLLLQPLVENACIHGFQRPAAPCSIIIQAQLCDDDLLIHIRDNGVGMPAQHVSVMNVKLKQITSYRDRDLESSIGIYNVHERICLRFGFKNGYGLQLSNNEQAGITVTARIPAKSVMELRQDVKNNPH